MAEYLVRLLLVQNWFLQYRQDHGEPDADRRGSQVSHVGHQSDQESGPGTQRSPGGSLQAESWASWPGRWSNGVRFRLVLLGESCEAVSK